MRSAKNDKIFKLSKEFFNENRKNAVVCVLKEGERISAHIEGTELEIADILATVMLSCPQFYEMCKLAIKNIKEHKKNEN